MKNGQETRKTYEFEEFRIGTGEGKLWRGAEQIALTHKVFDLLTLLIERRGTTLTKNEIIENLWRDTSVDENNRAVTVGFFRRRFGAGGSYFPASRCNGGQLRFSANVSVAHTSPRRTHQRNNAAGRSH